MQKFTKNIGKRDVEYGIRMFIFCHFFFWCTNFCHSVVEYSQYTVHYIVDIRFRLSHAVCMVNLSYC
jgi:hypothetical protein